MIKLLYFVLALPFCLQISYAEMTGKEIMEKQKNRHELKYEQMSIEMILENKKGRKKNRGIVYYAFIEETGFSKVMLKFLSPADIKNVGLLTWEHGEEKEDDQWLYLPASKKVKRITSGGKKNKFMGTDYAFEDLRPENLSVHDYELKGSQNVENSDCYVVEARASTKKEKKSSGYGYRKLYISKDIFFTIKCEYFDKKEKMIKVYDVEDLENIKDDTWRAKKSIMRTLKTKHSTSWLTVKRNITEDFDNNFFTHRNLKKPVP